MSIFNNLFRKKEEGADAPINKDAMEKLAKSQEMRNFAMELQSRLSKDDQKELARLALLRDPEKISAFIKSRVPDLEEVMKRSGF